MERQRQEDDWNFWSTDYPFPVFRKRRHATSWYLQYCEISPGLKDLPPDECGKNSIHFILSPLQGWREAEVVPLISVEVHMHLAKRHYLMIGGAILVAALTLSAATF